MPTMIRTTHRNQHSEQRAVRRYIQYWIGQQNLRTRNHNTPKKKPKTQASLERPRPRRRRYSLCDFETKRSKPVVCKLRVLYCVCWALAFEYKKISLLFRRIVNFPFCFCQFSMWFFRSSRRLTQDFEHTDTPPLSYHSHISVAGPITILSTFVASVFGFWWVKGNSRVCALCLCVCDKIMMGIFTWSEQMGTGAIAIKQKREKTKKQIINSEYNMRTSLRARAIHTGDSYNQKIIHISENVCARVWRRH